MGRLHEAHGLTHELVARVKASSGQNSASGQGSSSASALLSALIPAALVAIIFLIIFLIFRGKFQRIYAPRTFLGKFKDYERTPRTKTGMFGWVSSLRSLPDDYILNHQSIDGYFYLRYIKMIMLIFFIGCLITWPILFPVNATAKPAPAGVSQFDKISYSNTVNDPNRYYAHAFLAWIFFGMVLFIIGRETVYYIHVRQAWLLSTETSSRMSSRTVLFTDVPEEFRNEAKLRTVFPHVKHVWMATDTKQLEKDVKDRDKTAMKLEGAEISLSKAANSQRLKMQKKNKPFDSPMEWADEKKRPKHKLKFLIGPKVDTIDWCRGHLQTAIPEVETSQATHWNGGATTVSAVFVEFETIQAAESAYQQLVYKKLKTMTPRAIGMVPREVIWSNLGKSWSMRKIMYAAMTAVVVLMIIFWVPFTIFVGAIANLPSLTSKVPFLSFINDVPSVILGVITGLLPAIILSILMALVPIFLRIFAKLTGKVTVGEVELLVQNWYFAFQVIQVFLVTTFASGAAATGAAIAQNPSKAPALLAANLPKASNFYNSYVMFQGIGAFGSTLLNIGGLAVFIILKSLLMKTPRKRYNQYLSIAGLGWGSTYPKIEIFAVIAFAYAIISPLVMGFTALGLLLFYIANKYMLMYVLDTTNVNTQGATYPRALQHLFVGIYISLLCLIGLLAIETANQPAAAGPLVIVFILLVFVIFVQVLYRILLGPLVKNLPKDLIAAHTPTMGDDSSLENGSGGLNGESKRHANIRTEDSHDSTANQSGLRGKLIRLLKPKKFPTLAPHYSQPVPAYTADVQREAYLDPAITSPTPLLWLVHDEMGISTREKELSGKVIGVTDQGAFWNEKGKLTTVWEGQPDEKQDMLVREAPIHEERILY